MKPKIIGAGLAGLIAANTAFQDSEIIEAQSLDDFKKHKALLRFRSPEIGKAVGIDFKEVVVRKGIYHDFQHYNEPNIKLANMYSQKVNGKIEDRSIWNLETCKRWIAPDDFHEQLIERCLPRISFGETWKPYGGEWAISTMPMPVLAKMLGTKHRINFRSRPISSTRFLIKNCNTYQTLYFPGSSLSVYRASITGNILTVEHIDDKLTDSDINTVFRAFHISEDSVDAMDSSKQNFGKISQIDDSWRKKFIFEATYFHNVYSLGRFAVWKQILLDDVLKDIYVINKMLRSGSSYENVIVNSK